MKSNTNEISCMPTCTQLWTVATVCCVETLDMQISMDIASLANCAVRDNHGNLLPFVWTRQSVHNEHENASLLTRDALQKQMINFIESTANDNLKMLQKVSDPALLVDWVVRTAEHWERRYAQKRNEKYDVSQTVSMDASP